MPLNNFNYSVQWSDFQKLSARPQNVNEDAQIHPEMQPKNLKPGRKDNAVIIAEITIDIALVKADCWVLSSFAGNADLLKHEQGHYDIVALSAREFYDKLRALKATSVSDLQQQMNALNAKVSAAVQMTNDRYDTQTSNSRNVQVQQQWDQAIAAEKLKITGGSVDNLPQ